MAATTSASPVDIPNQPPTRSGTRSFPPGRARPPGVCGRGSPGRSATRRRAGRWPRRSSPRAGWGASRRVCGLDHQGGVPGHLVGGAFRPEIAQASTPTTANPFSTRRAPTLWSMSRQPPSPDQIRPPPSGLPWGGIAPRAGRLLRGVAIGRVHHGLDHLRMRLAGSSAVTAPGPGRELGSIRSPGRVREEGHGCRKGGRSRS